MTRMALNRGFARLYLEWEPHRPCDAAMRDKTVPAVPLHFL